MRRGFPQHRDFFHLKAHIEEPMKMMVEAAAEVEVQLGLGATAIAEFTF